MLLTKLSFRMSGASVTHHYSSERKRAATLHPAIQVRLLDSRSPPARGRASKRGRVRDIKLDVMEIERAERESSIERIKKKRASLPKESKDCGERRCITERAVERKGKLHRKSAEEQ